MIAADLLPARLVPRQRDLLARPLPQDLSACHAMIGELRAALDEYRASFGEVDFAAGEQAARAILRGLAWRRDGSGHAMMAARLLVALASATQGAGSARVVGYHALRAVVSRCSDDRDFEHVRAARASVRVAALHARRMLVAGQAPGGWEALVTHHGVGLALSPAGARWVFDLVEAVRQREEAGDGEAGADAGSTGGSGGGGGAGVCAGAGPGRGHSGPRALRAAVGCADGGAPGRGDGRQLASGQRADGAADGGADAGRAVMGGVGS